jgi:hypothetical protein
MLVVERDPVLMIRYRVWRHGVVVGAPLDRNRLTIEMKRQRSRSVDFTDQGDLDVSTH